jgi:hypothetical protein
MAKKITAKDAEAPVQEKVTETVESPVEEALVDEIPLNIHKIKEELSKMSLPDLMSYKEMVETVYEYYSNMSQATVGGYTHFTLMDHDLYEAGRTKYLKVQELVFDEIKSRVDAICQ